MTIGLRYIEYHFLVKEFGDQDLRVTFSPRIFGGFDVKVFTPDQPLIAVYQNQWHGNATVTAAVMALEAHLTLVKG